jgi:preprotein translocase subunit YajC
MFVSVGPDPGQPPAATLPREGIHVLLAQDGSSGGSSLLSFLPIILIIAAMYFLLIRPQNKRRREAMEMQSKIGPGDEILTVGGLYGTVVATDDESVTLAAAPGVELRFARSAIGKVLTSTQVDEPEVDEDSDEDSSASDDDRKKN